MTTASEHAGAPMSGARAMREHMLPGAVFFLLCYFMVDYFGRLPSRLPLYPNLRPTLVLVALISLTLITQGDRVKDRFRETPLILVTLLLGYILLSFPLVEWPGSVIRANIQDFIKAIIFLFFVAIIVDTDQRLKRFVALFLSLQVFRVLEPLYYYWITGSLSGYTYVAGAFKGRLNGAPADVVNANGLAFVIVSALGFMHFLMARSPVTWVRWAYYVLLPTMCYALYLTASRGGFIVFGVLLVFMFWDARHKGLFIAAACIAALIGWTQMSDFHQDRYLSLVTPLSLVPAEEVAGSGTVEGRLGLIEAEFQLGLQRPLVGHGLGTTAEAKGNKTSMSRQAAHNLYAQLLIETGIIGFIIFVCYLISLHQLTRRNLAHLKTVLGAGGEGESFKYRLNKALFAVFWIYAVYSFNYFGLSQEYWYLYGGLCVALARSISRDFNQRENNATAAPS